MESSNSCSNSTHLPNSTQLNKSRTISTVDTNKTSLLKETLDQENNLLLILLFILGTFWKKKQKNNNNNKKNPNISLKNILLQYLSQDNILLLMVNILLRVIIPQLSQPLAYQNNLLSKSSPHYVNQSSTILLWSLPNTNQISVSMNLNMSHIWSQYLINI